MAGGVTKTGRWSGSNRSASDFMSRPRFEAGSYLTAADCRLEQGYRLERLRRHDRQLHGYGVVCDLWVVPLADPARPWGVRVCPGYAVGPYGDEMQVSEPAVLDLRDFLWARAAVGFSSHNLLGPSALVINRRPSIYVAIRAIERLDRLVVVPSAECGCADPVYRESRISDDYEIAGVWTPPPPPAPVANLCAELQVCPPCPDSPWLALARVVLPAAGSQPITTAMIDNGIRRQF